MLQYKTLYNKHLIDVTDNKTKFTLYYNYLYNCAIITVQDNI